MSSVPVDAHRIVRVNMIDLTDAKSGYHNHHNHHHPHHSHKNTNNDKLESKQQPYCKSRRLRSDRSKFPSSSCRTHPENSKQVGLTNERRVQQHRSFLHAALSLDCCTEQIKLVSAIESNEGGKGEQVVKIHRMSSVEQMRTTNSSSLSLLSLLDDEADGGQSAPTGTTESPSSSANTDESNDNNDESDNSTQIPFENEYIPNDNNNYNNNNRQTTTRKPYQGNTASMGTTIQPVIKQRSSNNNLRITEIDLLPFSEFTIQQPAFSDLMRSWPPTALQTTIAAADQANKRMLARQQLRGSQQHSFEQSGAGVGQMAPGNGRPNRVAPIRHQQHHSLQQQQRQFELDHAQLESFASVLQRNHLNEDFDDTIVTADQSFESDELLEPPTWINYLGEWGDFIYVQLQQYLDKSSPINGSQRRFSNNNDESSSSANETAVSSLQQLKIESIDELLDDYYYDQYENSQVLYYGPQLVREGDIFEIGCFMPNDQPAEWSKSGKPLLADKIQLGSPRVIRRSDFLGAKQNFSLKVFEASLSDSGNYRCNKMSRKYHKLVVVPLKATTAQIYHIQQRLLSVVNPAIMSSQANLGPSGIPHTNSAASSMKSLGGYAAQRPASSSGKAASRIPQSRHHLVPGYLIMENRPLVVNCHITDEQVLRLLRENPQFRLKWYKNGKQLRGNYALPSSNNNHLLSSQTNNNLATSSARRMDSPATRSRSSQQTSMGSSGSSASFTSALGVISPQSRPNAPLGNNQRIQFLQANGRQLYISGAQYSDAGDYSCMWSSLGQSAAGSIEPDGNARSYSQDQQDLGSSSTSSFSSGAHQAGQLAGSLVQLLAPVKLRPFKSTYNVRQGNQLRLICQAQRGHPAAHISWYVGNRLVDNEFLREHADEFRIIQPSGQQAAQSRAQVIVTSSPSNGDSSSQQWSSSGADKRRVVVEINPVPASRQQMQLTANGHGQWIEYRDPSAEKYAIETAEQQSKYLQLKLAQLTSSSAATSSSSSAQASNLDLSQTSISVLVINSLNLEKHTSRYACRATTRANTDEVTTVIRVQAASTVPIRPANGRATLIPGQPLHFQCQMLGNKDAEFLWYWKPVDSEKEHLLEPNNDDTIEIHNDRLTIHNPKSSWIGDYYCRALKDSDEWSVIKVRTLPYIEDFGLETSHTGRSSSVTDGDRLELNCTVRDTKAPVNITWLRSTTPDDERTMVPINEVSPQDLTTTSDPFTPTVMGPEPIVSETLGSHSKRLIIESVRPEHRSFYVCMADNGITERARKVIFIRVKDKLNALWPFLGIVAELFILFIIIHVWETQRAYKEIAAAPLVASTGGGKRPAAGASVAFESVPLTSA